MPERLLGSSMGLLQKGMEEILDWNEEKEKKSPSFSGAKAQCGWDSMCSSSKHCSGVGRMKAPQSKAEAGQGGRRGTDVGTGRRRPYSGSLTHSLPVAPEKSLLKCNPGLCCSVGNHGRSQKMENEKESSAHPHSGQKGGSSC